jgi:hypothetical protein
MREAVSNAMRMLSEEPLILGTPVHCATDGIVVEGVGGVACAEVQVKETWRGALGAESVTRDWREKEAQLWSGEVDCYIREM